MTIQITITPSTDGSDNGLHALRLIAEGKPSAQFVVSRSEDGVYLRTEVELAGAKLTGNVFPLSNRDEAQLISKELEILGRDALYEQALAFFSSILL